MAQCKNPLVGGHYRLTDAIEQLTAVLEAFKSAGIEIPSDNATGANPTADILTSGTWGGTLRYLAAKFECNFGNGFFGTTAITSAGSNGNGSLFEYDVPSGYYALNTKNINTYG